jgi:hypothetical protein
MEGKMYHVAARIGEIQKQGVVAETSIQRIPQSLSPI